jgi:competence protein ComEC
MTIIYLGIAWLVGIGIATVADLPVWPWLAAALTGLVLALILRRQPASRLWLFALSALFLGAARYTAAVPHFGPEHVAYFNGQELVLTGLIAAEPQGYDRILNLRLEAESIIEPDGSNRPVEGEVLVATSPFQSIPYGARLRLSGRLETPPEDADFSYREYLAHQGIHSQMNRPQIELLAEGQGSAVYSSILTLKERAKETIQRLLPDPQAALLTGILLGDDNGLPPELDEQFRVTGMSHIIAISGFNIAILTGVLLAASRPIFGHKRSAWFVLAGIALYTILVGADAAVVRAAIMGALFVIAARLLGRPTFAPAGLFAAAIAMTLADPYILWNIGFQLSFAATLGLMLYVGPWSRWAETRFRRFADPETANRLTRTLSEIVLATLAAMLLTLPIIAYHFGQLSLVSPLANLFILPAQPGVMIWGGVATLAGMVAPAVGQLFAWVAWLFLTWTIGLVRLFAGFPLASVPISISPLAIVALFASILGLTWYVRQTPERRSDLLEGLGTNLPRRAILGVIAIVAVLTVAWALSQPDGKLHVSFLDVGQGDATFIQTPTGRQILIDGGALPSVINDHLGRQIPFWDRDIDIIVATHPDVDHVAGLPGVFDGYLVGRLITNGQEAEEQSYQALLTAASENETPIHPATAGEVIAIGDGVQLEILNSSDRRPAAKDRSDNDNSVAIRLLYDDFSLLLTGDAGETAEREMLSEGRPLAALVYQAGHHGSRTSSTAAFLEAVQPQYVIVSAGEDNRFGHPHEEMLQRAADVGAAVLRTDKLGTIEVISDGKVMWWESRIQD